VVTRSPDRGAELAADLADVPAYESPADLLAAGVDAVTITTPPRTRRELVLQAAAAGVPTIADKPFAPDADGGRDLVAAARSADVPLTVFHNRRWDADIRTLAAVLAGGELGELTTAVPSEQGAYQDYYSRFAAALHGDGDFPVPAEEAVHTLAVLDAARSSAPRNQVVDLPPG
jgi:predicted dehydrogenase